MFAGQEEIVASTAQVEIRIAPGMEVGATSERETGIVGGALAGVVDEDDGEMENTGEFAQSCENGRDLGGVIFVDALKTDVGVQYQKLGLVEGEGFAEPGKMVVSVEPEGGLEDKLHIKRVEVCSTCSCKPLDAFAYLFGSILSGIEEHPSALIDFEAV